MMKVYNLMEDMVKEELDNLLTGKENICKCAKCKLDMMAWALNRLSPKYVVSDKGRIFTRLQGVEIQFRADVTIELMKAMSKISKNPQHQI